MADAVPASEFTKNFGRYKIRAQREAVAVSSHGQIAGYFVAAHEYEELLKLKDNRRSFATTDLSDEEVEAIKSSRMASRHDHLNELLDEK
jgi:predicted CopG family antitoxin